MIGSVLFSQNTKTLDLVLMMILVLVVISVSSEIVRETFKDNSSIVAQSDAEHLATSLALSHLKSITGSSENSSRLPASVANRPITDISRDPWGKAYHYTTRINEKGAEEIIVWSAGPNGKFESDELIQSSQSTSSRFRGDDIGYVFMTEDMKSADVSN